MTRKPQYPRGKGKISRRAFLGGSVAGASLMAGWPGMQVWGSQDTSSTGRLLVTLQLDGGVDVTMFTDPKVNVSNEPKINHWADELEPNQIGAIPFAPVARNRELFERFGSDLMVVNGVDAQTNSHETGRLFNWTGRNAEGQPSLSALFAAAESPEQPLAYSVFGGVSRTAGIIGYNRFDDLNVLRRLAEPNMDSWSGETKRWEADLARSQQLLEADVSRLLSQSDLSVRERLSMIKFTEARERRDSLSRLAELIPPENEIAPREDLNAGGMNFSSNLKQQMQSALLVFKSGLGSAADLSLGGFDSHEENEPIQEALLSHIYEALVYFWDSAEALGLADRIFLVMGSDFGRTNFINEGNGKDHWPIGSYVMMERGALWGDRVIGQTDDLHFARGIDPATLKVKSNGLMMTPSHIHKAIQEYLGIEGFASDADFGLANTESLPLFDPFIRSTT